MYYQVAGLSTYTVLCVHALCHMRRCSTIVFQAPCQLHPILGDIPS